MGYVQGARTRLPRIPYVLEAQGSLPPRGHAPYVLVWVCTGYLPRAYRAHRVPWLLPQVTPAPWVLAHYMARAPSRVLAPKEARAG